MLGEVTESIDIFRKVHPLERSAEDRCFLEEMTRRLSREGHADVRQADGQGGGRAPGLEDAREQTQRQEEARDQKGWGSGR